MSMNGMKPLPTIYKGVTYRSRLEARWANVFDLMEIPVMYEPDGYYIDGRYYLPDFRIGSAFIEIKPVVPDNFQLYSRFAEKIGPIFVICGPPKNGSFSAVFAIEDARTYHATEDPYNNVVRFDNCEVCRCRRCDKGFYLKSIGEGEYEAVLGCDPKCECDRLPWSGTTEQLLDQARANRFGT